MAVCGKRLGFAARLCAVLWLVGWVAALCACTLNCGAVVCDDSKQCHTASLEVGNHEHHGDASAPEKRSSPEQFCSSLQSAVWPSANPLIFKPAGCPVLTSAFAAWPLFDFTDLQPPSLRQIKTREWLFTPEVYLGPAFRSLAPPILS